MTIKNTQPALVALLLVALFVQVFFSMRTKSPTADELAHHTASGYSHLMTGDFRMNPAEPPLSRLLSAVPLYFLGARLPLDHPSWKEGDSPEFARQFFYKYNSDQDRFIFWARMPILILSLFFAYFVFVWSHELFGPIAGLGSLALFVFCPDILAHSGLATSDIAVAFFFYMTLWRFWKYLKKQSRKNFLLTGVMAGLAFLSKFSAILLFPILLSIVLLSGSLKKVGPGRMAGFLAVCFLTVWAGYFFEMKPLLKNTPDPPKKIAVYRNIGGEGLVRFANEVPVPLSTFVSAVGSMMATRAHGTNCFLMGEWSNGIKSWWYYYPLAFGIKNTLPLLLLILLSFVFYPKIPAGRTAKIVLAVPIAIFFLVTMRDRAQAGIRYFLPVYPLFFLICGGVMAFFWKKGKWARTAMAALLIWHAAESAVIYPDYLAYFNELIGGPANGYKYLRDSNLDWGQDLKGLAAYAKKEGYPEVVLMYYGSADPAYYGLPYRVIRTEELEMPEKTVYAIAAHHVDSVRWYQKYRPVNIIGHSIFVYDLRK